MEWFPFSNWNIFLSLIGIFSFLLTFLFGILLLFFHNIFKNLLFALGHGTVCRSCFFWNCFKTSYSRNLLTYSYFRPWYLTDLNRKTYSMLNIFSRTIGKLFIIVHVIILLISGLALLNYWTFKTCVSIWIYKFISYTNLYTYSLCASLKHAEWILYDVSNTVSILSFCCCM